MQLEVSGMPLRLETNQGFGFVCALGFRFVLRGHSRAAHGSQPAACRMDGFVEGLGRGLGYTDEV